MDKTHRLALIRQADKGEANATSIPQRANRPTTNLRRGPAPFIEPRDAWRHPALPNAMYQILPR
ncbi:MAG: hypothetical protein BGO50_10575 [Rhodanobacter sp. 67-28]|nr:MAG: hypothetical protein BGO50_10575 [Rhodanobacter sp. 67-28]